MKKIITLAVCLATFCINGNEAQTAPVMKKIVIKNETLHEDGTVTLDEQELRAIAVTPEQAAELKAQFSTEPVAALENSRSYNQVFMIENTAYFIVKTEARASVRTNVTVTDDVADIDTTSTQN
jgi:lysozyme family protein